MNDVRQSGKGKGQTTLVALSTSAKNIDATPLSDRNWIEVFNDDASIDIFLGFKSSVTSSGTTQGRRIPAKTSFSAYIPDAVGLWVIAASGTPNCSLTEIG